MNCDKSQQYILLRQSGELSSSDIRGLDKHLADCAACREYLDSVEAMMSAAASPQAVPEPGAAVMAAIRRAARDEADRKTIFFPVPAMQWAAYAAAAVFIVCGTLIWSYSNRLDNHTSQVTAIVLAVGNEENLDIISQLGSVEKGQELQALASHLLLMEGFGVDESLEVEPSDAGDEPLPTALRLRSIDAFDLQRCV